VGEGPPGSVPWPAGLLGSQGSGALALLRVQPPVLSLLGEGSRLSDLEWGQLVMGPGLSTVR